VQPEIPGDNKITINSFLKQSYNQARKQIEGGVNLFQDGVSYIKDEFSDIYDRTGHYLRMALPINNFLKDLTQIDTELSQEVTKDCAQYNLVLNGTMVPVDQVLSQPMEENY